MMYAFSRDKQMLGILLHHCCAGYDADRDWSFGNYRPTVEGCFVNFLIHASNSERPQSYTLYLRNFAKTHLGESFDKYFALHSYTAF